MKKLFGGKFDGNEIVMPMPSQNQIINLIGDDGDMYVLKNKTILEMVRLMSFDRVLKKVNTHLENPTVKKYVGKIDQNKHDYIRMMYDYFLIALDKGDIDEEIIFSKRFLVYVMETRMGERVHNKEEKELERKEFEDEECFK